MSEGRTPGFLENTGELGKLIREHDWTASGLGPPEQWPSRLQGYTDMILRMPTAAIIFWGPQQIQIYNAGYSVIMGPRHPKYLGSTYKDCWPDTYPTIYPWMQRVLEKGEVIEVNRTLIPLTRYGFHEEAYFTFSFVPLRDDDGSINGFIQPVAEVTETVLAERRLTTLRAVAAKATTRAELIAEATSAFKANAQDLPFAALYLVNPRTRKLELATHPGIAAPTEALAKIAEQVLATGEEVPIDDVARVLGGPQQGPWLVPTKSALALPLKRPRTETASGVLVLGISPGLRFDEKYRVFLESLARELSVVFEQQNAQQELRDSEARLRRVVEASGAGTWEMDPATGEVTADPRLLAIHGLEGNSAGLAALMPSISPEDRPRIEKALQAAFAGENGGSYAIECRIGSESAGGEHWIESRGQMFFDDGGKPARFFGTALDITERKKAENEIRKLNQTLEQRVRDRTAALEEANRELEAFSYSVSHDLRAPLRHITGFAGLLERRAEGLLDAKAKGYLKTIADAAQQGGRLVDDLLAFSRMGRAELKQLPLELSPLVASVQRELQPDLAGRRVTWRVGPLPEVLADPSLMQLVLRNLLSNALKYTRPREEAVIEIRAEERPDETEIVVRDNGVGFSMSYVDKLFGVFQRLHTAEEFEGTGIGLANVRRIIQRHGGKVWAEGAVGQGATFHFTVPRARPKAVERGPAAAKGDQQARTSP